MITERHERRVRKAVADPLGALRYVACRLRYAVGVRRAGSQRAYYERYVDRSFGDGNPAIGHDGQWSLLGQWQFDVLREAGLSADDAMLDVGCGPLRGGQHFVDYLDAGNYVGMDISSEGLRTGRRLLRERGLVEKRPDLVHNFDLTFREPELHGRRFDLVFAQSVVTHLDWDQTAELFEHLPRVLAADGQFVATFFEDTAYGMNHNGRTFRYSPDELRGLCRDNGLRWERFSPVEPHPNGHEMMRVTHR